MDECSKACLEDGSVHYTNLKIMYLLVMDESINISKMQDKAYGNIRICLHYGHWKGCSRAYVQHNLEESVSFWFNKTVKLWQLLLLCVLPQVLASILITSHPLFPRVSTVLL